MVSRSTAAPVGALLLLLGLALMSWLAIERHRGGPDAAVATQQAGRLTVTAVVPAPSTAAGERFVGTPSPAEQTLQPGDVEVCGFGVAKAGDSTAADALERRANWQSDDPARAHLARMLRSADAKTRAAALMVERNHAALVAMAVGSKDPTVYAFALQICQRLGEGTVPADCQMISHEQAARLDADNGAAWLHIAAEAHARQDSDGVAAALHGATAATVLKQRQFNFATLALAALPPELPKAERTSAVVAVLGMQAALSTLPYRAVTAHCAKALMDDANRRQTCDAVAELLVGKGHSLLDLAIGRRVGEWAGWPRERVELLSARLEARSMAQYDAISVAPGGLVGCAAFAITERYLHDAALLGEGVAAEALLLRAGVSQAMMLARYRKRQAERAASAASAPSPAPSTDRSPAASTR